MLLLRVKAAIMRLVVLLDTACNFNAVILISNCLITGASTLYPNLYALNPQIVVGLKLWLVNGQNDDHHCEQHCQRHLKTY